LLRLRNGPRRTGGRLSIRAVTGSEVAATVGPSANSRVVEARNLVREYGSAVAVAGVDLQLGRGEFLSIFGPNGAGKSSLLGMLSGALRPSSGTVHVMGRTVDDREATWRRHIGVLSHRGFLYGQLTAEENLRFYGTLYGLSDLDKRVAEQLRRVGLEGRAGSRVRALSHGMRQRSDRVAGWTPNRGQGDPQASGMMFYLHTHRCPGDLTLRLGRPTARGRGRLRAGVSPYRRGRQPVVEAAGFPGLGRGTDMTLRIGGLARHDPSSGGGISRRLRCGVVAPPEGRSPVALPGTGPIARVRCAPFLR
jgi:hypothetical protein